MCGIAGLWTADGSPHDEIERVVVRMRDALAHRGPDAHGSFIDARRGIGLGHRRLAILDLSPQGRQPMASSSDRYWITYNGEVYNFAELRAELEGRGRSFKTGTDTEVMLAAFETWGMVGATSRFVGMFAFAVWDAEARSLRLGRDRLGIKPLYVARIGRTLAFGSELKALLPVPGFRREVDRSVLAAYFRYNCVPGRAAIYKDVARLMPGTLLAYTSPEQEPVEHRYWSAEQLARQGRSEPLVGSDEEVIDALQSALSEAVRLRMLADVPLGAFLSGGIDSSTVVALMQAQSSRPVRTFSIGYREAAYDESKHAAAVAAHLGTDHTELLVSSTDALELIPSLPELYDEPFSDSSQIPTHLVCKLARQHVTVALSGDGGDELFGGYNRHLWAPRLWRSLGRMPGPLRRALGGSLRRVPPWATDALFQRARPLLPRPLQLRVPGEKLHKLGRVLGARDEAELYRALCSHQAEPLSLVLAEREAPSERATLDPGLSELHFSEAMMLLDLQTYLPDDILTKVDRASMAVALEARVPILDHRVVALAWRLPLSMKIRDGVTKWALRQVLYRHVPRALVDREKSGFGVPIDAWLRGPLRDWAEALLDPGRLQREGYLRPEPVAALWREHLSGRHNHHHQLWDVLMFQAWLERWGVA